MALLLGGGGSLCAPRVACNYLQLIASSRLVLKANLGIFDNKRPHIVKIPIVAQMALLKW